MLMPLILAQVLHDQLWIAFEHVAVAAAGALADHVDLAVVAQLEGHAHVVAGVLAARDRALVHQPDDVELLDHLRVLVELLEDVDAIDLHQLVARARVAAEQALRRRELGPLATRHEAPHAGPARGGDLLVAHAAAVLAETDAVLGQTLGTEADDRRVFLVDLVLAGIAHEAEHRRDAVLAVGVAARALPVAVDVAAEIAGGVAVLGDAAVDERGRLVVLRGDDRRVPVRHRVVQLVHRDGPADAGLEQRHQAHRLRHLAFGIDDRVAVGDDLDRREHRHRVRQVRPDVLQQAGTQRRLERGDVGVDRAVHELRGRAAEIHDQPIALLVDRQADLLQHVLAQRGIHELQHARGAVRQFLDAAAHLGLGVLEMQAQRGDEGILAELLDDADHAFAQTHRRVQLHLHVLELQLGIAHRVLQEGDEIALELEVLDDLERRHLDAFVVLALRGCRQAARLAGAVLALVHRRRHPADQLALVEQRQHHRLVGVVDAAVARIVVDEAVAVAYADGRIIHPVLDDEADRVEAAGGERDDAVRRDHRQVALRGVDAGHQIAPLGPRRGAHLVDHLEAFGQRRVDQAADVMDLVRVRVLRDGDLLHLRALGERVVAHDLGIGPEKQPVFGEELIEQGLVFGGKLDVIHGGSPRFSGRRA